MSLPDTQAQPDRVVLGRTRVYLAGPMTGYADYNRPAFTAAAEHVRAQGWVPVNPHDTDPTHDGDCPSGDRHGGHPNACWYAASLAVLASCDAVLMLPGWEQSEGARLEHDEARRLGLPVRLLAEVAR